MQRSSTEETSDGWKVSGSGSGWDTNNTRSSKPQGRSFNLKELKEQQPRPASPQTSSPSVSPTPSQQQQQQPQQQPLNRFQALHLDEQHQPTVNVDEPAKTVEEPEVESTDKAVFKAMAMYDEFVTVNSMEGLWRDWQRCQRKS